VVASLNFTRKCFRRTCDALVVTHDPLVVSDLREMIAADRDGRRLPPARSGRLIVGPERARDQLAALIAGARSTIRLIDAKFSDRESLRLLLARKAVGVTVEIFSARRIGGLKSHGKLMLIDGRLAVVGSIAMTGLSLDLRRELAIAIDDRAAVAEV